MSDSDEEGLELFNEVNHKIEEGQSDEPEPAR